MFDSLFGSEVSSPLKFVIAFAVVIGLIALTAWLVRRFGAARLGGNATRGRQPRLAVIDAAPVDGRRRLVLIRRDNIEHLLMIGGPSDVVVEQNIVRSSARSDRGTPTAESTPRTLGPDNGLAAPSLQPSFEPSPMRARFGDDNWTANETPREPQRDLPPAREPARDTLREPPRVRPDSLTGMAADLSAKLNNPDLAANFSRNAAPAETFGRSAPAAEPARRAPEPDVTADKTDHNLAEMASRLEAALRRPTEGRPPVTDPLAVAPVSPPRARAPEPRMPEPRAAEPRPQEPRSQEQRFAEPRTATEPRLPDFRAAEPKAPAPAMAQVEPRAMSEPTRDSRPPQPSKSAYESLEQEMASLLGRPANK